MKVRELHPYFREMKFVLGEDYRKTPFLLSLYLIASVIDVLGIGLIGPYVGLLINPELFSESKLSGLFDYLRIPTTFPELPLYYGFALIMLFSLKAIAGTTVRYLSIRFAWRQNVRLRSVLMKKYMYMPYVNYVNRNSSEFIQSLDEFTQQFTNSLSLVMQLISEGLVALMIFAMLAFVNIWAVLILTLTLGVSILIFDLKTRKPLREAGLLSNQSIIESIRILQEALNGLKEIRILKKEEFFIDSLQRESKTLAAQAVRGESIAESSRFFIELVIVTSMVTMVTIFIFFGEGIDRLVPLLAMFGVAALRLAPAAMKISSGLPRLRFYRPGIDAVAQDLREIGNSLVEETDGNAGEKSELFQTLELSRVKFRYTDSDCWVLNDVSLTINQGEAVGIVGPSGSGKTTLIDVALGFFQPQAGEILCNGKNIGGEERDNWRSYIAYLPQDVFLIDGSLEENITLGVKKKDIEVKKLSYAVEQAQLTDVINSLPLGLESRVGEDGIRLSGGQKQRVSLARALYHDREVLIMDEATSALDDETEREIVEEIKRLKGKKTLIVIAHRLSTIQHCDTIYRIDKGSFSPDAPTMA